SNTGDVELRNVQVTDDLSAVFAGATNFSVITPPSVTGTGALQPNASYTGTGGAPGINLLTTGGTLVRRTNNVISFTVRVTPGTQLSYNNVVNAVGTSPAGTTVNATDSQPVVFTEAPSMTVVKSVGTITNNGDGTYDVAFQVTVSNTGDVELRNVQ